MSEFVVSFLVVILDYYALDSSVHIYHGALLLPSLVVQDASQIVRFSADPDIHDHSASAPKGPCPNLLQPLHYRRHRDHAWNA